MPSLLKSTLDHAFVRSKRTGDVDIRRAKQSSHRFDTSLLPYERTLHYLGKERIYVCRCSDPKRHFERTSYVASESRHLSADLTLYLERHGLESCAIADFWGYHDRQEDRWEKEGVYASEFHYASRDKDFVCRCLLPRRHDYGTPRNSKIIEQCAEFFCVYKGELTATKKQWKCFDGDSPPAYSSSVKGWPDHLGLLQETSKKHRPSVSLEMKQRSTAERRAPFIIGHCRSASTSDRQPEMPPQVWQRARSSIWTARPGTETVFSTPMGTEPPSRSTSPPVLPSVESRASTSTPWYQVQRKAGENEDKDSADPAPVRDWLAYLTFSTSSIRAAYEAKAIRALIKRFPDAQVPKAQATKIMPRNCGENANHPTSVPDATSDVPISKHPAELCGEDDHGSISSRRSSPFNNDLWYRDRLHYQTYGNMANQIPVAEFSPRRSTFELPGVNHNTAVPFGFDDRDMTNSTPLAAVPARHSPVELPTTLARQRHAATLKELEGRDRDTASELKAIASRARHEQAISGTFNHARKTVRVSSLFEQVLDIATFSLPSQKEFLLRHAVARSLTNPVPVEHCELCGELHRIARDRHIVQPGCGCSMHELCFLHDLRKFDQQFGRCPVCRIILCKRTLTDRIGSDIEAIFGSQITSLEVDVTIEFPRQSQTVTCSSDEGVASAQLRLLKEYVDHHAEEVFRLWEANRAEPDWYAGVVSPIVKLLHGWNPSVRSRFFVDNEAFQKLIAWAELVRLMNTNFTVTKRTLGSNAQLPRLEGLHLKFAWAQDRYDQAKKTRQTKVSGVLDCDRIAVDAVKIAMSTYP